MWSRNKLLSDTSFRRKGFFKSLYIHVPFCKNICDYCALYSVVDNRHSVRQQYIQKILKDLEAESSRLLPLTSIFVGGGTPSQLTEEELSQLLDGVNKIVTKEHDYEFTLECNPSLINQTKLSIMYEAGVNRLSFGAQSTTKKTRNTLGRRTSAGQLMSAIENAHQVGFTNINVDLIYGVPGQTMEDWCEDVENILSLQLPHLSAYSLILEEETVISKKFSKLDDELAVEMYQKVAELVSNSGLERYEISNYARSGFQCCHNYLIWKGMTYLGIGPAASSFDGSKRWTQIADLMAWLDGKEAEIDELSENERLGEIVGFGFRTTDGWSLEELKCLYELDAWHLFEKEFLELLEDKLLEIKDGRIKPTAKGLLFADDLVETFL